MILLNYNQNRSPDSPVIVSYGGGKNSTALLILCQKLGIKVDLILFADTGGEIPQTYEYIEMFSKWLVENGMPAVTVVKRSLSTSISKRSTVQSAKTALRFVIENIRFCDAKLIQALIWRIYITASPYQTLEEYCLITEQLPSVAYGIKMCSKKFKIEPFESFVQNWEPAKQARKNNLLIRRLKGIHAKEINRLIGKNGKLIPLEEDGYRNEYPLIKHGLDDIGCQVLIASTGLPVPPKSSCFFCPNRKIKEILDLPEELRMRAELIEQVAKDGIHAREDTSTKGLGRKFAWSELGKLTPLEKTLIEMQQESRQCHCVDE